MSVPSPYHFLFCERELFNNNYGRMRSIIIISPAAQYAHGRASSLPLLHALPLTLSLPPFLSLYHGLPSPSLTLSYTRLSFSFSFYSPPLSLSLFLFPIILFSPVRQAFNHQKSIVLHLILFFKPTESLFLAFKRILIISDTDVKNYPGKLQSWLILHYPHSHK